MKTRGSHYCIVVGRLKREVSMQQGQSEMDGIARRLAQAYPDTNTGQGVFLERLDEEGVRNVQPALLILEMPTFRPGEH